MPLPASFLAGAPRALLYGGLGAGLLALFAFASLARTIARRRGVGRGLVTLLLGLALGATAAAALALCVALAGYQAFTAKTRIAEIQCMELSPQHLRVFLVPVGEGGARGATETYDVDGNQWTVGGEILRFRPFLTALGVRPAHHLDRVEGRWLRAADANAHRGTAHDREGGMSARWLLLERHGARGPLGWLVAGVHGQAVSQLPDRLAVYDLFVAPDGYVLEKRQL